MARRTHEEAFLSELEPLSETDEDEPAYQLARYSSDEGGTSDDEYYSQPGMVQIAKGDYTGSTEMDAEWTVDRWTFNQGRASGKIPGSTVGSAYVVIPTNTPEWAKNTRMMTTASLQLITMGQSGMYAAKGYAFDLLKQLDGKLYPEWALWRSPAHTIYTPLRANTPLSYPVRDNMPGWADNDAYAEMVQNSWENTADDSEIAKTVLKQINGFNTAEAIIALGAVGRSGSPFDRLPTNVLSNILEYIPAYIDPVASYRSPNYKALTN